MRLHTTTGDYYVCLAGHTHYTESQSDRCDSAMVMDKSAGQSTQTGEAQGTHPSPESYVGRTVEHRSGHRGTVVAVSLAIVGTCITARLTDETGHEFVWGPEHISAWTMTPWCDYCETDEHQTEACPHPDHDAYDAVHGGVAHCCADYARTDGPFGSIVETHTRGCDAL